MLVLSLWYLITNPCLPYNFALSLKEKKHTAKESKLYLNSTTTVLERHDISRFQEGRRAFWCRGSKVFFVGVIFRFDNPFLGKKLKKLKK